ncbi:MAG: hypothetical protein V4864_21900 [Pseudomonadota bacterium]
MAETPRADAVTAAASRIRPRTLFAMTTLSLVMAGVLIGVFLLLSGRDSEREFSAQENAAGNRFLNVRLLAALKTFEYGFVARDSLAGGEPVPPDAAQLLRGVGVCGTEWNKRSPGMVKTLVAEVRGQKTDPVDTGAALAAKLEAMARYLALQRDSGNLRTDRPLALDTVRWFEAVNTALLHPVHPADHPGVALRLQCGDIAEAVNHLMPRHCQAVVSAPGAAGAASLASACVALDNLAWRGTTAAAQVRGHWRADQVVAVPDSLIAQRNPWRGVPGCVYLRQAAGPGKYFYVSDKRRSNSTVCEEEQVSGIAPVPARRPASAALIAVPGPAAEGVALDDARWSVPPSLGLILRPLDAVRLPGSALYKAYTERSNRQPDKPEQYGYGPNQARIGGVTLDVGYSVELSTDARTQALAQQVAACYTGAQSVCRALGIRRQEDKGRPIGASLLEQAMVRMAAVAIIDIESGRIDAIAGALSPCTRQDYDGPGRGPECDGRLPWKPAYRPDLLENPALFHDAMPASTVKPIMAAAFLSDGAYGAKLLAQELAAARTGGPPAGGLRRELMRSDSARFLDRMFCAENEFGACERPWRVQAEADVLGWNAGCGSGAGARADCGKRDVLFGIAAAAGAGAQALTLPVMYGRLLSEPARVEGARFGHMPRTAIPAEPIRDCAQGADGRRFTQDDWEKCHGNAARLVAEGWGQGHARATTLGIAGAMALLGAAANGAKAVPAPHLVSAVRGTGALDAGPGNRLRTAIERFGLNPPTTVAVPQESAGLILGGLAWSHRGGTASSACNQILDPKECSRIDWLAGKTGTPTFRNDGRRLDDIHAACERGGECSTTRPHKWYTAVYRQNPGSKTWDKAIAVLVERNWVRASGQVHGAGDQGPNPAAEIAVQIVSRSRAGAVPAVAALPAER